MGGPRDNCNEKGKSDKDKYQMISLICGLLKNDTDWTYLQNRNRVIDTENKLMVIRKGSEG